MIAVKQLSEPMLKDKVNSASKSMSCGVVCLHKRFLKLLLYDSCNFFPHLRLQSSVIHCLSLFSNFSLLKGSNGVCQEISTALKDRISSSKHRHFLRICFKAVMKMVVGPKHSRTPQNQHFVATFPQLQGVTLYLSLTKAVL